MPELPEVENVVLSLQSIIGQTIRNVKTSDLKMRISPEQDFELNTLNQKIVSVKRRSKYILIELSNNRVLVIHLGMSGRVLLKYSESKHNHLIISLDNGQIILNDPRRFGLYATYPKCNLFRHPLFKNLGIEPLSDEFTYAHFKTLWTRKTAIKNLIMNANFVVGVGNIYANEALYIANIHPLTLACDINDIRLLSLYEAIKDVLQRAIKLGGSTLRDYVNAEGKFGSFQNEFQIYDRLNEPCLRCSTKIIKFKVNGRASYVCATCQIL